MAQSVLKEQLNKPYGFESTLCQGKEVKWMEEKTYEGLNSLLQRQKTLDFSHHSGLSKRCKSV